MIVLGIICMAGIMVLPLVADDYDHLAFLQLVGFLVVACVMGTTLMLNML